MPPIPEPLRGSTDLLVLSVLDDEPLYGYAVAKRIEARSDGRVRLTPGVLYPLLHQLEREKLVLASWDAPRGADPETAAGSGAGRPRKWYRLSAKGRRRLAARAAAHRAAAVVLDAFLPRESTGKERA